MEKRIGIFLSIICVYSQSLQSDAESIARCFWANYQYLQKNKPVAEKWFVKLFEESVPFSAYEGYINFLFATKRYDKIYAMKEMIITNLSSNNSTLLILSDVLSIYKEEHLITELLYKTHLKQPNSPELTIKLATFYLGTKDHEKAIATIDAFLNTTSRAPNLFLFYFLKAQIFMQLNRLEDAITEVNKTVEIFPSFDQAWLFLGMLYEQLGHTISACEAYNFYLAGTTPQKSLVHQKLTEFILQYQKLVSLLQNNKIMQKELYTKAQQLYTNQKYTEAMRCVSALLMCDYEPDITQLLQIDIFIQQKLYKTACNKLEKYIIQQREEPKPYIEKVLTLAKNTDVSNFLGPCCAACAQKSNSPEVLSKCVDFLLRHGNEKDVISTLVKLFSQPIQQTPLFDATTSLLISLYHKGCQFEKLQTIIETALSQEHNSLPFLNNAAYYYATKGKNIEKASQYIKSVMTKSKKYEYLDTYALVLYKQNQAELAKSLWHQLLSEHDNDPYVLFHYASASYKEKKYELARALLARISTIQLPVYLQNKVTKLNQKLGEA